MRTTLTVLLAFLILQVAAPSARAQKTEIEKLAAEIAFDLDKAGVKEVAVAPFDAREMRDHAPYKAVQALREQFEATVANSARGITFLRKDDLRPVLRANHLLSIDLDEQKAYRLAALASGAEAVVLGALQGKGKKLKLSVEIEYVHPPRQVAGGSARVEVAQEAGSGSEAGPLQDPDTGVYMPGKGGVGYPSCISCPLPGYSDEGRRNKWQGTVEILATIQADGRLTDGVVLVAAPYGLTEKAVAAIRNWKFRPATGPDGKPVATRVMIETRFRLYDAMPPF